MTDLRLRHILAFAAAALVLFAIPACTTAVFQNQIPPNITDLATEVRLRIALLPGYSVFDYLSADVERGTVVLSGRVIHAKLKSDAEAVVKKMKGVTHVQNDLQLLPASPSDDQLRRATYHAIYNDPALARYRYSSRPLIHILVERGNVALEGSVYQESDATVAELRAKSLPRAASVKNNLRIQTP